MKEIKKANEPATQKPSNKKNDGIAITIGENQMTANETTHINDMINTAMKLRVAIEDAEYLLNPKIHVCTQSGKSIVPVYAFFVDGVGGEDYFIECAAKSKGTWIVLGAYKTLKRALQVYEEMLQCPITKVYTMPPR
jgi:hypothetical protein